MEGFIALERHRREFLAGGSQKRQELCGPGDRPFQKSLSQGTCPFLVSFTHISKSKLLQTAGCLTGLLSPVLLFQTTQESQEFAATVSGGLRPGPRDDEIWKLPELGLAGKATFSVSCSIACQSITECALYKHIMRL